jgi:putative transcriptional regulator
MQVVSYSFILPMEKEAALKKLGERIREVRNEKGITQVKLAHTIGKDQQSIQRLEAGNVNPTYYYLLEIAAGLDTTVANLLPV